jgi:hypothetical protein
VQLHDGTSASSSEVGGPRKVCDVCGEAEKRESVDGKSSCETKEMKTCWTDAGAIIHGFRVRVGLLQPLPWRSWSGAINAHNLFGKMLELEKVEVSSLMQR